MKVTELNADQLQELRQMYNYDIYDSTSIVDASDIPDSVLFDYYDEIEFQSWDFTGDYHDYIDSERQGCIYDWAANEFANALEPGELEDIMTLLTL